jgi:hypothetical protein
MKRTELLKNLLIDFCFEKNIHANFFFVPRHNEYVHVFIEEDTVTCEYTPTLETPTKWSAKIEDKDFGIRLYSTVFFARRCFFDYEGMKEIRELKNPILIIVLIYLIAFFP